MPLIACPDCGHQVADIAPVCPRCGRPFPGRADLEGVSIPAPSPSVPNYLPQAILTTLCCCLPIGVIAIVFAAQVNGRVAAGDYAGALSASRTARILCWVAFGLGLVIVAGYMVAVGAEIARQGALTQ
jgi:hypothetical protein